ncbi:MAG: hypothetical protein C0616_12615 [Desulfuromonas sp.]|nr:MAG: hypothetical protein C0616_12615 [Desulfuromonas sp.]
MNGHQIKQEIAEQRNPDTMFIRWWRKENDFVDYEKLDTFLSTIDEDLEFAGYELLDMNKMWDALKQYAGGRVKRENRTHGEVIVWTSAREPKQTATLSMNAESLMEIFDMETRGDTLQ